MTGIWSVYDCDDEHPYFFSGSTAQQSAEAYAQVRQNNRQCRIVVSEVPVLDVTPAQASYIKTVYEADYGLRPSPEEQLLNEIFGYAQSVNVPDDEFVIRYNIDIAHPHSIFGDCSQITEPVLAYNQSDGGIIFIGTDPNSVENAFGEYRRANPKNQT